MSKPSKPSSSSSVIDSLKRKLADDSNSHPPTTSKSRKTNTDVDAVDDEPDTLPAVQLEAIERKHALAQEDTPAECTFEEGTIVQRFFVCLPCVSQVGGEHLFGWVFNFNLKLDFNMETQLYNLFLFLLSKKNKKISLSFAFQNLFKIYF